ncbi:MAG: polar amino acid transport system permease protein [Actinomycetota bacterium]|jgi:His/Glu/Gln/Arg/opine family amino acid ABC transporter permease subunit
MTLVASFDWHFIWEHIPDFWTGLKATLKVAAIGIGGSLAIGIVLGAARAHRIPVLSWLAAIYVEVIRNTPILVQIFFIAGGLTQIPGHPIRLEPFTIAWLSVMIWGGAYNTENFRAGFEAVPWRYREAGLALGFSRLATFVNVTLPIGARIALPSSINTYVSVLKNTSLLTAIGFAELTDTAYSLESQSFKPTEVYFALGATYLLVVWTLSALVRLVERRLAIPETR